MMQETFVGSGALKFWIAVCLMPLNWGLEALKWKLLVQRLQPITFFKSLESVLSALSLGVYTPNRIGEFGGRVLLLQPENRVPGFFLSVLSSWAQVLVTLFFGGSALFILDDQIQQLLHSNDQGIYSFRALFKYVVAGFVLVMGLFYFNVRWWSRFFKWLPFLKAKQIVTSVPSHMQQTALWKLLLLSLLRFLVFAFQTILIWQALQIQMEWIDAFGCISLAYLFMAIIPSIAIAELGIRGKVTIAVASLFTTQIIALLAGTLLIWMLNLVLPALIGSLFLLTIRIFKENP
jgi:hypothetical protein